MCLRRHAYAGNAAVLQLFQKEIDEYRENMELRHLEDDDFICFFVFLVRLLCILGSRWC
jgi:hypothetical protein